MRFALAVAEIQAGARQGRIDDGIAPLDTSEVGLDAEHCDHCLRVDTVARLDRRKCSLLTKQDLATIGLALGVGEPRDIVPDREFELRLASGGRLDHRPQVIGLARVGIKGLDANLGVLR